MHGKPGSPGIPGRDGRDGREGAKGDQGIPGKTGPQGPPGPSGKTGANGNDGAKGERGAQGPPGQKGERGESGLSGTPGNPGLMAFKNWKECVWKNINSEKDNGLIKVNISRYFIRVFRNRNLSFMLVSSVSHHVFITLVKYRSRSIWEDVLDVIKAVTAKLPWCVLRTTSHFTPIQMWWLQTALRRFF